MPTLRLLSRSLASITWLCGWAWLCGWGSVTGVVTGEEAMTWAVVYVCKCSEYAAEVDMSYHVDFLCGEASIVKGQAVAVYPFSSA